MSLEEKSTDVSAPKAHWFTTTHWSVVLNAGNAESPHAEAALEKLCRTYWYPLYSFVRRQGHGPDDAQDLTQEFFARLLEKNYLGAVEREKGKFRSFLLGSLKHFLANERVRAEAAKRGGGKELISLDDTAEDRFKLEPVTNASPEKIFEQRWAVTLLEQAFARLESEFAEAGKSKIFARLKGFLAEGSGSGDYAPIAAEMGMSVNSVAVTVHRLRQRYRELVRAEIANTVSSPAEIDEEMRNLFAALAG